MSVVKLLQDEVAGLTLCLVCHNSNGVTVGITFQFNPLKPKLNPICYLLALLGAHHFPHISRIRVNFISFRNLPRKFKFHEYPTEITGTLHKKQCTFMISLNSS